MIEYLCLSLALGNVKCPWAFGLLAGWCSEVCFCFLAAAVCGDSGIFLFPLDLCFSGPWAKEGSAEVVTAALGPGPDSGSCCSGDSVAVVVPGGAVGADGLAVDVAVPCPGDCGVLDVFGGEDEVDGVAWGCGGAGFPFGGDSSTIIGVSGDVLGNLPFGFRAFIRPEVRLPPIT